MSATGICWVVVQYRKRKQAIPTDVNGSCLFVAVSREFNVPPERAKLVLRGKTFRASESAEVVRIARESQKAVFDLVAARVEEQLDHGHTALRRAGDAFYWEWGGRQLEHAWVGVRVCLALVASVLRIFFSSLFTTSSAGSGGNVQGASEDNRTGSSSRRGERTGTGNLHRRHPRSRDGVQPRQNQEGTEGAGGGEDLSQRAALANGGTVMSWLASLRRW